MLSVRFWGVRGSMPCPGPDTVVYGGNTACLEIRAGERLIIVDCGTGIRPLGDMLLKSRAQGPVNADIFITHTHWDHIMGFPMFNPLYIPGTKLRIRGPVSSDDDATLEAIIGNQLSYRYWPVRQSELAAKIQYDQLKETTLNLGDGLIVFTKYLNHPILCIGYRFEYQGKSIVTVYDHEPFRNLFPSDPQKPGYDKDIAREGEAAAKEENEKINKFFSNADVLIHDTQFNSTEFESHIGWGHSSFEMAIDTAKKEGVKRLVFFHHDPNHNDAQLETMEKTYQAQTAGTGLNVIMAREGLTIEA